MAMQSSGSVTSSDRRTQAAAGLYAAACDNDSSLNATRDDANLIGRLTILDWPAVVLSSSRPLKHIPGELGSRFQLLTLADDPPPLRREQRVLVAFAPLVGRVVVFNATIVRVHSTATADQWLLELMTSPEAVELTGRV
jgi:hypothetical protein